MSLGHLESLCYKEISCFKCNFLLWLWADAEICCCVIQEGLRVPRETNLKMFAGWVLRWWKYSWCVLFSTAGPSSTWLPNSGNVASTTEELNFKLHCILTSLNLNRHTQLTATVLDSAVLENVSSRGKPLLWAPRVLWIHELEDSPDALQDPHQGLCLPCWGNAVTRICFWTVTLDRFAILVFHCCPCGEINKVMLWGSHWEGCPRRGMYSPHFALLLAPASLVLSLAHSNSQRGHWSFQTLGV